MINHRGRRFALPPSSKEQFGNHHNCNILQKHRFSPFSPFRRRWCSSSLPPTWPLAAVRLLLWFGPSDRKKHGQHRSVASAKLKPDSLLPPLPPVQNRFGRVFPEQEQESVRTGVSRVSR